MNSLSWQAPSFHYVEKSSAWYMWSIVVSIVVACLSLLEGNLLFLFFVIIAEAIILLLGHQKPKLMLYEATDTKIIIAGQREHVYAELKGFSLLPDEYNTRYHELVLTPVSRISTHVKIIIPSERAADVKALISSYITEIPYEETLSDSILKRIGL